MSMICPKCQREYDDGNTFCAEDGEALAPAVDPLVGRVIDNRLRLERKLGEGGMGRVYLAQHTRLPLKTAVKVLHPNLVHEPEAVRRFNEEAERAARIIDDHVVRVHDFGQTPDGLVYLEMEYVDGRPLNKLLDETGPLAPRRVADIVVQIAAALAAAHEMRIVHRDLKPENVMIAPGRDGRDRVKVVDFGIAKMMAEGLAQSTKTGQVIGTPDYMSPEQLGGARDLDGRSDIYSLALAAFVMLTGQLAFPDGEPYERMMTRLIKPPRTLAEMKADTRWPAALQAALDKALAREAVRRYASAVEFAGDLSRAIGNWMPGGPRKRDWWSRFKDVRPAYRWAALPIAAGLVLVTYGLSAWRPVHVKQTKVDSTAHRPPKTPVDTPRPPIVDSVDAVDSGTVVTQAKDDAWVRQQLGAIRRLMAAGEQVSTSNASSAISIAREVLPHLKSAADSVEAQYHEVEAYLDLTPIDNQAARRACTILKRIREPARNTRFAPNVQRLLGTPLASEC